MLRMPIKRTLLVVDGDNLAALQRWNMWNLDFGKLHAWARKDSENPMLAYYVMVSPPTSEKFQKTARYIKFRCLKDSLEENGYAIEKVTSREEVGVAVLKCLVINSDPADRVVLLGDRRAYSAVLQHLAAKGKEVWLISNQTRPEVSLGVKHLRLGDMDKKWALPT
jgi:uncharacterized LabA/DUF88 family protein